jgi:serine-type D-Ala-D-Ala carboxypeptidase
VTPELPGVAAVLEAGVAEGVAPAASACVLRGGQLAHASCHGIVEEGGALRPVWPDDLFDLASLTKVLATTGLAAQLAEEGRLSLDAPAARYLPALGAAGKEQVTVRQLLAHSSGLPAYRPFHEAAARDAAAGPAFLPPGERPPPDRLAAALARGRALVAAAALAEPLEAPPGARALYSDVGFIALGLVLEAAGGAPLPALWRARLQRPLGLRSTFFLDGLAPTEAAGHRAGRTFLPTGHSRPRGAVSRGEVNDDNAFAMGGAAGHAGLFSTAAEVAALGQAWLDALDGRQSAVPAAAAQAFARRDPTPGSERALGWDTPGAGTSLGERLGRGRRGAIGHLGYTGTSLWIDLDAGLVCALLTNHTHPTGVSQRERIRALRRRFHDAVAGG